MVHDSHFTKYSKEYKRDLKYLNDIVCIILPWNDKEIVERGKFEKPSWMILCQNILDGVKSSGTIFGRTIMHNFVSKYTRYGKK